MDGKPAEAGVGGKVGRDRLGLAVHCRLPFLKEGHLLRPAARRAVRSLEAHQDQVRLENRVRIRDLVLVEADQAIALVAVGRAGEVPVAHHHDLVEVKIDDVLVDRLDRPARRICHRCIPVETDRDGQPHVAGQEGTGALIQGEQVLKISLALRLRRLDVENHAVELRCRVGCVVGDDLGHALQGPGRLAASDGRPVDVPIRCPDRKVVEVRLADQVSHVAVLIHQTTGAAGGRMIDAEIEVGHAAGRAALDKRIAAGQGADLIGEHPDALNLRIRPDRLRGREAHATQDDYEEQYHHCRALHEKSPSRG